jgi:Mrp family chromosome partitioning ATPase
MYEANGRDYLQGYLKFFMGVVRKKRSIITVMVIAGLAGPLIYLAADLLMSLILAVFIGLAAVFTRESLRTAINTAEEAEEQAQLPVLGVIPYLGLAPENVGAVRPADDLWAVLGDMVLKIFYVPFFKGGKNELSGGRTTAQGVYVNHANNISGIGLIRSRLIWNCSPDSPFADSYRVLSGNMLRPEISVDGEAPGPGSRSAEEAGRIMVITAIGPQAGTTVTAVNLALTLASQGELVLLVDMELSKPFIHEIFGLERENGLSDMLVGIKKLDECIHKAADVLAGGVGFEGVINTQGVDNFHIMTAGTAVPKPDELLTRSTADFFSQARRYYRYIICDCPPALPFAEIMAVGHELDMAVLVCRSGKTAKGALIRAVKRLISAPINVKGLIINQAGS